MAKVLLILESDVMQKLLSEVLPDYEISTYHPDEAANILKQSQQDTLVLDTQDNAELVTNLLDAFCIQTKERVIQALGQGILLAAEDPDCLLTKDIYSKVCKKYGTTTDGVDQTIRRALRNAWCNRHKHPAAWEQFFPEYDSCPSNGVFISALAAYLRKKYPSRFRKGA